MTSRQKAWKQSPKVKVVDESGKVVCKKTYLLSATQFFETGVLLDEDTYQVPSDWRERLGLPDFQKADRCYACKAGKDLTRHHVVPRRVMRLYDQYLRSRCFANNIVMLCKTCHARYEKGRKPGVLAPFREWTDHIRVFAGKPNKPAKPAGHPAKEPVSTSSPVLRTTFTHHYFTSWYTLLVALVNGVFKK